VNLVLLLPEDFISEDQVKLTGRRAQHLLTIKRVTLGDRLLVGQLNGQQGQGRVIAIEQHSVLLKVILDTPPIAPLPVHLILALPRPKMLKRILQTISAMGVKQLSLIHCAKVEKSYWQSPWLEQNKIAENLFLGLEQAQDTLLPKVTCYQRFKPFVEDRLAELSANTRKIIAHPGQGEHCALVLANKRTIGAATPTITTTLAIGPEGGFTDYEIALFEQVGFKTCHLGERILRVENAIPVLLGQFI